MAELLQWALPIIISIASSVGGTYFFMVRRADAQEFTIKSLEHRVETLESNKISEALIKIDMRLKQIEEKLEIKSYV